MPDPLVACSQEPAHDLGASVTTELVRPLHAERAGKGPAEPAGEGRTVHPVVHLEVDRGDAERPGDREERDGDTSAGGNHEVGTAFGGARCGRAAGCAARSRRFGSSGGTRGPRPHPPTSSAHRPCRTSPRCAGTAPTTAAAREAGQGARRLRRPAGHAVAPRRAGATPGSCSPLAGTRSTSTSADGALAGLERRSVAGNGLSRMFRMAADRPLQEVTVVRSSPGSVWVFPLAS